MTDAQKKSGPTEAGETRLQLAAIGLEAEFALVVDGAAARPEDLFRDPRDFIRGRMMHRRGTSYHLPTGGAAYFDTGVLEIATPVIEIARGCGVRAGRSLWEAICYVRSELDAWQHSQGRDVRLVGFSTHYNVSFERAGRAGARESIDALALLLSYILPAPVMLLATNRRSTGVGVRPRRDRIEVTADFTPSAPLLIATAAAITGIVRAVMRWPSFDLDMLERRRIPVIAGFQPMRHTSRKGWLARHDCYPRNPFEAGPDAEIWTMRDGVIRSLRGVAAAVVARFWRSVYAVADPFTARLIRSVLDGRTASLLDLSDRPPAYEDVGRACRWSELYAGPVPSRSRYERVLMHALAGEKLRMGGRWYTPLRMLGWSRILFRRDDDGERHAFSIDHLLGHLDAWGKPAPRRLSRAAQRTSTSSRRP